MTEQTNFSLFNKKDTRNFMRLLKYLTPYKIRIVWALLAIMVVAVTESYLAAATLPPLSPLWSIRVLPRRRPHLCPARRRIGTAH